MNRRCFLVSAVASATGAVCYSIYQRLQSPSSRTNGDAFPPSDKHASMHQAAGLDTLKNGESLFDRELCIAVKEGDDAEPTVRFVIRLDDKGICIAIGNKRYRSVNGLINKAIDTAIVRKDDILLRTKYYGAAVISSKEVTRVIGELAKRNDVTDIVIDASYEKGMLTSMLPDSLFQKRTAGDRPGYSITFISDDVPADQLAQLQF